MWCQKTELEDSVIQARSHVAGCGSLSLAVLLPTKVLVSQKGSERWIW